MCPFKVILFDLGSMLIHFDGDWETIFVQANQALLHSLASAGLKLDGKAFITEFRDRREAYLAERGSGCILSSAAADRSITSPLPSAPDHSSSPNLHR